MIAERQEFAADDPPNTTGTPANDAVSPLRRQYLQIKRRFPDTILLFRLGDFYETFERDAEIAASVLDIVLTGRELGRDGRVPMAGIPHHAADAYIARLVAAGHKVAICEQLGQAERGRGLIDRDVTRVVTPGTVTDPAMLAGHRNTYLAAVVLDGSRAGIAYADLSTGEFAATQVAAGTLADAGEEVSRELLRLGAAEVVIPTARQGSATEATPDWMPSQITVSRTEPWLWQAQRASETLRDHFGVASLDGFGLSGMPLAIQAAGGLIAYLADTQRSRLTQIQSLRTYSADGYMILDARARQNLELDESSRGDRRHGLLAVLDEARTPMGARLLRRWLGQPLIDLEAIRERQVAVQRFVDDAVARATLRARLSGIADVERLANRAVMGASTPRELGQLRQSLERAGDVLDDIGPLFAAPIDPETRRRCRETYDLLVRALSDEPPVALGSGEAIRAGFAFELDDHQRRVAEAREWIAGLERQERLRTGIRSLKVGYNRVFGYYIEISTAALAAAERDRAAGGNDMAVLPADYLVRQSLANGTRYVTAQLKEYEAQILSAQETLAQLEAALFARVLSEVAAAVVPLCEAAAAIAFVDVVSALADVAAARGYIRPIVDDSRTIEIISGRHPTLEALLSAGEFVPNDAFLDDGAHKITILTGPNMAGKSSWLRQVALIVLMAQIGSFVPATSARIGLVDRIFTRIGAQDDISSGQSTFMVEMLETASLLHHASERSLVLLDEIGRGTSTWDGLAIARSIVEYLHNAPRLGCRTLFATHFHELTAVADLLPGVCCARMDVLEEGDRIVFLHRVVPGAADRSYGIHVAELAGIPKAVTRRAREVLTQLESGSATESRSRRKAMSTPAPETGTFQLTLFAPPHPALTALRDLDVESLSPIEALTRLYELKQLAGEQPT